MGKDKRELKRLGNIAGKAKRGYMTLYKKSGKIGMVKPSGWQNVKYPEQIEDLYLYNRCHLIAWCLTGENANEKNLITGTRYMNVEDKGEGIQFCVYSFNVQPRIEIDYLTGESRAGG